MHMPKFNRRSFLVGTAAAGGRPRARLRPPVRPEASRSAADGAPEVNAWVVDQARRHRRHPHRALGDGTGHADRPRPARRRGARLRLVEGHDRISDARRKPRAQARVGRISRPAAAAASASRTNMSARAARPRAMMLIQAAANAMERAGVRMQRRQGRDHAQGVGPHARPTARWRTPPPSSTPPKDVTLKDPKDWKIAGKPLTRLDTADKLIGKQIYGIDVQAAGHAHTPRSRHCPVFGGKLKSFDAAKVEGMPGVKKVVQVGDNAVAVVADTWWQRQDRARRAADRLGRRRERQGLAARRSPPCSRKASTPSRPSSATRPATPRPRSQARRRRSRRSTPIRTRTTRPMEPMNATAL